MNNIKNYNLASYSWDNKEIDAVQKILKTKNFTMGKCVKKFEKIFSKFINCKYALMVNSGSSANLLATAALFFIRKNKLRIDDEIIVPAVSWSTSFAPLQQYGLKLKFVDIDLETLNYNLSELSRAINKNTKAILLVSILGNPNDYAEIKKLLKNKNIYIIEDNAEALGSEYNGKIIGNFADISTYSTFFSHHISTIEGGVICTNNKELYQIILSLRAHGWLRNLPKKNLVCNKTGNEFIDSYSFALPGYNVRPSEINGAIGVEQMKKIKNFLRARRENAEFFKKTFSKTKDFLIQKNISNSSWFGFSIIIKNKKIKRNEIIKILKKNKISCRPIVAGNFLKNKVIKFFKYSKVSKMKNANYIHDNGFFVGNHHYKIHRQIKYLHNLLTSYIKKNEN
jgi:CDP-6-deoxy-D-xylo-4-hexulose-3-dehydrase